MRVLILGAGGQLGPSVVAALRERHHLVVTDVEPLPDCPHSRAVDISDAGQVLEAAEGTDAIINCAVMRKHPDAAFAVNTRGTYNALRAAVAHGHRRFINTGPRFTLAGPSYLKYDFAITEEIPPHPGLEAYAISKSAGHQLCRLFAENYGLHVLALLFSSFRDPAPAPERRGRGVNSFAVSLRDAAEAVRLALEVDLERLPSRCEAFFVTTELPHGVCSGTKAQRLLGWVPRDSLEAYWRRRPSGC